MKRWTALAAVAVLAGNGCAMDPDATLTLTADPVAAVTTAAVLTLSGTVTRTPPKPIPVFVEASGGVGVAMATVQGQLFSVQVTLNAGAINTITLKATDASGTAPATVVVTVTQQAPPGTLTITRDALGPLTSAADLVLTGTVTRTPAGTAPIIVRATGGIGSPADTVTDGHYDVAVSLHPDQQNTITLTALDDVASVRDSVTFGIRHDGTAPTVVQATPADTADGIATSTPVQIRLSEPAILSADGGILLTRQGQAVTGTTTLSADSLTLSFAPSGPLSPNAIYRLGFAGITDPAGNLMPFGTSTCFVTSVGGATASLTTPDSLDDVYHSTPPPGIAAPDLIESRFAREGETFSGVFRFRGPRSFARDGVDRAEIFIDLDTDQDSTTGFVTLKDTLFRGSGPPLDTITSGTRAEYVIGVSPLADFGDNAYVGRYTSPLLFQVALTFQPGSCGSFMGFAIPFTLVDDDGKLNTVVMGYAGSGSAIFVDPMPTRGSFVLDLPPPGPVAAFRALARAVPRAGPPQTSIRALPHVKQ